MYRPPNTVYVFTAYCTAVLTTDVQIILVNSNSLAANEFSGISLTFEDQTQAIDKMSLGKTNIKHYKIMRLFEIDITDNTAETVVEFNSTLGRYGFIFQIKHCLMIDSNEEKG